MSGWRPETAVTMDGSATLDRVRRGRLCTGCGACAAVSDKISIARTEDGFNRPVATEKLTRQEDRHIARICPGLGMRTETDRTSDPLWGRVRSAWSGHAAGAELRFRAASGGALSAVLVHLVESGKVDYILHTGADPDDPSGNRTVASRSRAAIATSAGSRYAPSSPLAVIEEHLRSGQRFAFVGKPCDVAALRAMARRDARIDAQVPYMLSFFCAGVPSRKGAAEILSRMGVAEEDVNTFRYRGDGWPGSATATLRDGSQRRMGYRESWGDILSKHVQFRCKICPDGSGTFADIVCGDAWHGDASGYPVFDEADGQSLILARTQRGEALVKAVIAADLMKTDRVRLDQITAMQPGQTKRMRNLLARLAALWITAQPSPRYRGFKLLRAAREASPFTLLRNFLGTGSRVLLGRR
ncbi:MAG: Coenzyme F420 hydrogenase/dehydrogenase, beta subunit C-terminal domain [Pseudomonadota bacterium]